VHIQSLFSVNAVPFSFLELSALVLRVPCSFSVPRAFYAFRCSFSPFRTRSTHSVRVLRGSVLVLLDSVILLCRSCAVLRGSVARSSRAPASTRSLFVRQPLQTRPAFADPLRHGSPTARPVSSATSSVWNVSPTCGAVG